MVKLFGKDKKDKIGKKEKKLERPKSETKAVEKKEYTKAAKVKKVIIWKDLNEPEINQNYDELKKELQELRFKKITSHVPNVRRIRAVKREIARALTYKKQLLKASSS